MRLTLRTLLAYLDDTLDPAEIKQIGQKVAESDAAQELIARIRQVTRRRRLTTPPATGPNARFEANTVADYLDSVLPSDQVAEIEKICLDSDVHLAEIAACHQILTLVLGEPVLVPPTAKRRMYGLVQGKETVTRKVPIRKSALGIASGDGHEADDTLLLGLPPLSRIQSMRWLVPAAAVLLVAGLALALWMAIPRGRSPVAVNTRPTQRERPAPDPSKDRIFPHEPEPELLAVKPRLEGENAAAKDKPVEPTPVTPAKPSTERVAVGKSALVGMPSVLLQQRGKEDWQRLQPNFSTVYTNDQLVSLPGFRSELRLDNKVHVLLWGNVEEAVRQPLLESAVVLHAEPAGRANAFDVDLTLKRGRIVISNQRAEPARVRVRFHDEVWDLTLLEQGTEVGLELMGREVGFETGEGPLALLHLVVLKGQARVKVGYQEYALHAPPGPAVFVWNNFGPGAKGPLPLEQLPQEWSKLPPATKDYRMMEVALDGLSGQLSKDKIASKLYDNLSSPDPATRVLATLSLGAIDALPELLDALADERFFEVREAAITALRHWLGREPGQEKKLKQALFDKGYTTSQTEIIQELLHTISSENRAKKETYRVLIEHLRHSKPAVRQLAHWHLYRIVPDSRTIRFDPGRGGKQLDDAYEQWQKLLADGKLPPKLPSAPPPMPPK